MPRFVEIEAYLRGRWLDSDVTPPRGQRLGVDAAADLDQFSLTKLRSSTRKPVFGLRENGFLVSSRQLIAHVVAPVDVVVAVQQGQVLKAPEFGATGFHRG